MICLVTRGDSAALPMPTCPSSVKTSTTSQPWKRERAPSSLPGQARSRSIGLVQKCGGSGTVLPRHSTTRVRILVIFMQVSERERDRHWRTTGIARQMTAKARTCSDAGDGEDGAVAEAAVEQAARRPG